MYEAINSGSSSENFPKNNPGRLAHSRWPTTGSIILRLYVSSLEPSENDKFVTKKKYTKP